MRLPLVIAVFVTSSACSVYMPAGAGGGGSDGSGGSGGGICSDPRCWMEEDRGWLPVPESSPAICTLDYSDPSSIPTTSLRWESCGVGCTRVEPELLGENDIGVLVSSIGRMSLDGLPVVVIRALNEVETDSGGYHIDRIVRLPDGVTLGAIRGRYDPADLVTNACSAFIYDERHPRLFALRVRRGQGGRTDEYRDATWLQGGGWTFRGSWIDEPVFPIGAAVVGRTSPVVVAGGGGGRVIAQLDATSDEWTVLDEWPGFLLSIDGDETLALWAKVGTRSGTCALWGWRPDVGLIEGPVLPGAACELAVADDFVVADLLPERENCGEEAAHRLWIGPPDGDGANAGFEHRLLGGMPIYVNRMAAYGDHIAVQAYSPSWGRSGVIVFRRSDGLERIIWPDWPSEGLIAQGLELDRTSLYLANFGAYGVETERGTILRYDLSRLDELGEAAP